MKNYGGNYGFVYYGWGFSLIIGPQISSSVKAATGSYTLAYYAAIGLIAISLVLVYLLKKPTFRADQIIDDSHVHLEFGDDKKIKIDVDMDEDFRPDLRENHKPSNK